MKFKKSGLLIIAGLLVIGIICGAGAAAADQDSLYFGAEDGIHVFDKDDVSVMKPFAVPMGYITGAAEDIVNSGYKLASTVSDGALGNLTEKIDEQIKNAWYYANQSDSIAKEDLNKTAANYTKVFYSKLMDEPLNDRESVKVNIYANDASTRQAVKKTYETRNPRIEQIIGHLDAIQDYQKSVHADTELSVGMGRAITKLETEVLHRII